jgi:hypothetical protein
MRIMLAAIAIALALPAAAQSTERPRPPGTKPLEEAPPPPAMVEPDASSAADKALKPVMTTRTEGENEITEYRVAGKLYMMRVKPKNGPEYILMDHKGDGTFTKQDHTLDSGLRVPQWVIKEF